MKIQILIISALFFFSINNSAAQSFCFTNPYSDNIGKLNTGLKSASNYYKLKVYFHVIRKSNSTGGQTSDEVKEVLRIIKKDYYEQGILFYWDGSIDYINNDSYFNSPEATIFNVNNHSDGIDIYLFSDDVSGGGLANGVGNSSEFFIAGSYWKTPYESLVKSHVASHEMGHVLFLWHTHHGTLYEVGNDLGQCAELVSGSNSSICGDYITDTPADPYLEFDVDHSDCQWNSNGKDANGHSYNPNEKLIMAYSHPDCMTVFTEGQGQRMRNAIATLTYLQNCTVSTGSYCSANVTLTTTVNSGDTDIQASSNTLTIKNTIKDGGEAIYSAANKIVINYGFSAEKGAVLNFKIRNCN